jgi:aminomuconate-semialdehyde/2-hydroxymuconate-6-semialdehyde dehydrogenase
MSDALVLMNHIGGTNTSAAHGATLPIREPATGGDLGTIPASQAVDVDRAVIAAQEAAKGPWRDWSVDDRAALCERIADALEARLEEFAIIESRDTGKPVSLTRSIDIPRAIANFRFFAGAVRHDASGCHEMTDAINYTLRRPVGVVGLITPWNLPLYLLTWKVAPAIATGNTIVAKPSEVTPVSAAMLADIVTQAGAPAGVFNVVHGLGPDVGEPLCRHEGVQAISFTGGTATGVRVGQAAAESFKKVSLELGGKNATVVFADADLEKAAAGAARAAFANQGQICLCGSRLLVAESIAESFTERFLAHVHAIRIGDPLDDDTTFGSLVSQAHRDKVAMYVALAKQEGGRVLTGGRSVQGLDARFADGAFYEPTVIADLAHEARTVQEEVFGPVVTLQTFDDEAAAIAMANGVRYGLAASIWTRDLQRAHRVSDALETGMVWVNCWLKRDLRVPFGGVKASGIGREGGKHSLSFYTESKNVCIQL